MSRRKRARPILIDLADNEDVPVLAPPEQLLEKSNNRVDDAVNRFYDDPLADFGFAVAPAAVKKRPREEDEEKVEIVRGVKKQRLEDGRASQAPAWEEKEKKEEADKEEEKDDVDEDDAMDVARNGRDVEQVGEVVRELVNVGAQGALVNDDDQPLMPLRQVEARPMLWFQDLEPVFQPGMKRVFYSIPQCGGRVRIQALGQLVRDFGDGYVCGKLLATRDIDLVEDAPKSLKELMPEHFTDRDLCEALQLALEELFIFYELSFLGQRRQRVRIQIYLYEPTPGRVPVQSTGHVDQAVALARLFRALFPDDADLAVKLHNRLEFDPEDPVTELLPRLMSGPYSRAEENPAGILLKMRRYQRESLAWMMDVEERGWEPLNLIELKFADGSSFFWHPLSALLSVERFDRVFGGMLCEEMGLGKTLEVLALVLSRPKQNEDTAALDLKATLIIVPPSLIGQWEMEFKKAVKAGKLTMLVYTGDIKSRIEKQKGSNKECAKSFIGYDIVLTTYSVTSSAPLRSVTWHRVVIDESQQVKSLKSKMSGRVRAFRAQYRWAASGTPIGTKIDDLYGQFAFLRAYPMNQLSFYDRHLSPLNPKYGERILKHANQSLLEDILSRGMMRHTKNQILHGETVCPLPPLEIETVLLPMSPEERQHYDTRWNRLVREVGDMYRRLGGSKMLSKFFFLNAQLGNVRRFCSLPFLPEAITSVDRLDYNKELRSAAQQRGRIELLKVKLAERLREPCTICLENMERPCALLCEHLFCLECISHHFTLNRRNCPLCRQDAHPRDLVQLPAPPPLEVVEEEKSDKNNVQGKGKKKEEAKPPSKGAVERLFLNFKQTSMKHPTKLNKLIDDVRALRVKDPTAKCIIFSQFRDSLAAIANALFNADIAFTSLDGTSSVAERRTALKDFNENPRISVFLLSQRAGSVGITLTAANTVFIFDHIVNPAVEEQSIGRCHRLGQTKKVRVVKYIMKDTAEEMYYNSRFQQPQAQTEHAAPIAEEKEAKDEKDEKEEKEEKDAMNIDGDAPLAAAPANVVVRNANTRKVGIATLLGFFGFDVMADANREAEAERVRQDAQRTARDLQRLRDQAARDFDSDD